jgi:Family of unknown function (DUF6186)
MIAQVVILGGFAALGVLAVVLVVHARGAGRAGATPTAYLATVTSRPAGRWLALVLWMWVGWHFFVR